MILHEKTSETTNNYIPKFQNDTDTFPVLVSFFVFSRIRRYTRDTLYIHYRPPMQPYQLKLTDLYDKLSSSPAGFTTETAKEKLAEY